MKKRYQILYIGNICSKKMVSNILETSINKPNLAPQKYHRLFAEGMAMHPDEFEVSTVSVPPVIAKSDGRMVFTNLSEYENNILYTYVPLVLLPILRNVVAVFFILYKIILWRFGGKHNRVIICDILNIGASSVSLITAALCGLRTITIVTDLPEMMFVLKERPSLVNRLTSRYQNYLLGFSYGYIFLTEAMNKKLNVKCKPYLVIEGLSDIRMTDVTVPEKNESDLKIVLYAGGLYEKFGVKTLLDAFLLVKGENYRLHLYGIGDMNELIKEYIKRDHRIVFLGYVPNQVVVEAQLRATLLVNPRFTNEEYTKYSFPSKNMEYMASGIPLVTTNLPGMPEEYEKYVYIFRQETIEGFRNTLESLLKKPVSELYAFGLNAKEFVLSQKNNKVQAEKFYRLIKSSS